TLSKLLTEARAQNAWLRAGSSVAQQQTLRTYVTALEDSFRLKRRGRPKAKRAKTTLPSLEYTRRGFRIKDGRLHLPNKVTIPVVWSRGLPSTPTSVRIYRDSLGHWYGSFVVRRESVMLDDAGGAGIGVDWGVTCTATTTDAAFDLPYLGHRRRCSAELAKAQRRMARRRPARGHAASRGYRNARRQAARIAKRASRQTLHDVRQWALRVVDKHSLIAVEDFKPSFLAKSRLARKSADAAIGLCKNELIYRAMRAGRQVVLVPPAYTTMTCSQCGARAKDRLRLGLRVFQCTACGYTAGRDRNAARTILATAERNRAGADDVRHAMTPFQSGDSGAVGARNPMEPSTGGANPTTRLPAIRRTCSDRIA
ncbi:MAG TPA: transposase, partial [Micromonosporaceae bacterium]